MQTGDKGASPATLTVHERTANVARFSPEMCFFNLGSMKFALHPSLKRIKEWRFEWEPKYLEASKDFVFKNTFADLIHREDPARVYN